MWIALPTVISHSYLHTTHGGWTRRRKAVDTILEDWTGTPSYVNHTFPPETGGNGNSDCPRLASTALVPRIRRHGDGTMADKHKFSRIFSSPGYSIVPPVRASTQQEVGYGNMQGLCRQQAAESIPNNFLTRSPLRTYILRMMCAPIVLGSVSQNCS